ncbi:MAG: hypothetical protein LBR60_08420 [Fibrobacter sp.]|jgi:hypothetical protein|nr:hypothetical protein [Fibrobacter sp.]
MILRIILLISVLSLGLISCENSGSAPEKPNSTSSSSEVQTQSSSSLASGSSSSETDILSSGENATSSSASVTLNTGVFTDTRNGREYKTYTLTENGRGITWFAEMLVLDSQAGFDYSTARNACPSGFWLPDDDDWDFFAYGWNTGIIDSEDFADGYGYYWSSTAMSDSYASVWLVSDKSIGKFTNYGYKTDLYSIRCVKDFMETKIFTDPRDGKEYKTGNHGNGFVWFLQDLNVNDQKEYTWNEAVEACPKGWHLPDDNEWGGLLTWTVLFRSEFTTISSGNWWSSTKKSNTNYANLWHVANGLPNYADYAAEKTDKNLVRCVKD